jgi:Up-Regulated in long-lived daf-2
MADDRQATVNIHNSGTGFLAGWKVHTLRASDADKTTTLWVFPTLVEFRSDSGKSETGWNPEFEIV